MRCWNPSYHILGLQFELADIMSPYPACSKSGKTFVPDSETIWRCFKHQHIWSKWIVDCRSKLTGGMLNALCNTKLNIYWWVGLRCRKKSVWQRSLYLPSDQSSLEVLKSMVFQYPVHAMNLNGRPIFAFLYMGGGVVLENGLALKWDAVKNLHGLTATITWLIWPFSIWGPLSTFVF